MSVTGISAHDGTTQQTASYSPFGDRLITATGASTNRLKYTGREQDSDTGLYYYRARYYDPVIGRFVSEDPLGFKGSGPNWYGYVANNPVNGNDPSGNIYIFVGGAADGMSGIVKGYSETFKGIPGQQIRYFEHDQSSAINDLIASQPKTEPINLIGHSWGGDTAASIAANSPRAINMLVTVDPVSWFRPDFDKVKDNTATWVNVNASPRTVLDWSNTVARIGNSWDSAPSGYATYYLETSATHAEFAKMMANKSSNSGSPADMLANSIFGGTSPTQEISADGDFLIYPNKPNNNQQTIVYKK